MNAFFCETEACAPIILSQKENFQKLLKSQDNHGFLTSAVANST